MLTSDEWNLLQELVYILSPFEKATWHLGVEKYVTYSIMHPIFKEIKRLLLSSSISSTSSSTSSPTLLSPTLSTPSTPSDNINSEIENADDIFILIEYIEIAELDKMINQNKRIQDNNQKTHNDNNQKAHNKIDLKVKENLNNR